MWGPPGSLLGGLPLSGTRYTEVQSLELELQKARNGLAMPSDRERVWQLEAQLGDASEIAHAQGQADGGQAPAETEQVKGRYHFATQLGGRTGPDDRRGSRWDRTDETREQAERSFRASDKEAWHRIAEEWMKLAETRKEPVAGVIGAPSRIYAVK